MKKQLLLTSALVSAVTMSGIAQAELKISASHEQTFAAVSADGSASKTSSARAFGNENNLSLSGGMDLSNGLTVGVKWNIEFDSANAAKKEQSLSIGTKAAQLIIASDFTQSSNSWSTPRVGDHSSTIAGRATTTRYTDSSIENNFDDHIAINVAAAGGNVTAIYAPNATLNGNDDGIVRTAEVGGSGTSVSYIGDLGVKGLSVLLAHDTKRADTGANDEDKQDKYGISYSMGQFAAGYERQKFKDAGGTNDYTATSFGATVTANDQLSLGLFYTKTEDDGTTTNPDEKIKGVTVGYNLAGLGLELSYAKLSDANNSAGQDYTIFQARTVVKF
jgi:hypothetical protein